jgi:predicted dehydrogenase
MTLCFASVSFKWELTLLGTAGKAILTRGVKDGAHGYTLAVDGRKSLFMPFSGVDDEMAAFVKACTSGIQDDRISAAAAFNDVATIQAIVDSNQSGQMVDVHALP